MKPSQKSPAPSNVTILLSTKLNDYIRLLYWILYFPQALSVYGKQYLDVKHSLKHKFDFIFITLLLSIIFIYSTSCMVNLLLTDDLEKSTTSNTLFSQIAVAAGWSVLTIFVYFATCLYLGKYLWMALLLPVSGIIASLTFSIFFRFSELPTANWINVVLAALAIGLSCGVLYSILNAYINYGLPNITHIIICGLVTSLIVFPAIGHPISLIRLSYTQSYISLIVVISIISHTVGFICGALRLDDWLWGLMNLSLNSYNYFFALPHVTPVTIPDLAQKLQNEANSDWKYGVELSKEIWMYTCQHIAVIRAIYGSLLTTKRNDLANQVTILNTFKNWRLSWFVHGENASITLLPDTSLVFKSSTNVAQIKRRELKRLVDKLTNSHEPITQNKQIINRALISTEQRSLGFFQDECETLEPISGSSYDIGRRYYLLKALEILESANDLLTLQKLDLEYPSGNYERTGMWFAIEHLVDTYKYIRLVKHCRQQDNRSRILEISRKRLFQLRKHEQLLQLTQEEYEHVLRIITNWEQQVYRPLNYPPYIRLTSIQNPYIYDEPLRKKSLLKGRDQWLAVITKTWQGEHLSAINITGSILSGKTSLIHVAASENKNIVLAYLSLEHLNTNIPAIPRIVNAICDILTEYAVDPNIKPKHVQSEPYRTLELLVRQICREKNETQKALVLVLDDFDHTETIVDTEDFASLVHFLYYLAEAISNFGLVVIGNFAGSELYRRYKKSASKLTHPIKLQFIPYRRSKAMENILHNLYPDYYYRFDPDAIDLMYSLTAGNPYLLQLIAWNVVEKFAGRYRGNTALDEDSNADSHEPFFTTQNVEAVLEDPLCREGVAYYRNRLLRCFGKDSQLVARILELFNARQKWLLAKIIKVLGNENNTSNNLKIIELLKKLIDHGVLKKDGMNYSLMVEILKIDNSES